MLKRMAIEKAKVKAPLRIMPATMLRGTTMPALSTSSPTTPLIRVVGGKQSEGATDSYGRHNRFLPDVFSSHQRFQGQRSPVIE